MKTTLLHLYCKNKSPLGLPRDLYAEVTEEGKIVDCFFASFSSTAKEAVPAALRSLSDSCSSLSISVNQFSDLFRRFSADTSKRPGHGSRKYSPVPATAYLP